MKKPLKKSGFTLVELLITIALFTIIVSIAVGGFTNALKTQRQVSSLIATQSNVSLALEQMTREIRTGYLFCHDGDINGSTPNPSCGCTVSASSYDVSSYPPSDPSEEFGNDLPLWTCTALDYYTADGTHVQYSVNASGSLMRSVLVDDGTDKVALNLDGTPDTQSITGDNVTVHTLSFVLFGNIEGDYWTPRITLSLGVAPSSTDAATKNDVLNLQTTVSARQVDCNTSSGIPQC
jgi:prepilin-type N-terminal cleavage/methylation domain-containing protein